MNLVAAYTKMYLLRTLRNRSAFVFGVFFPVFLFLIFGQQSDKGQVYQIGSFVIFCNYAVQSIFFLSLGLQISMSRSSDWTIFLRTLPAKPIYSMLGIVIEKSLSALLSLSLIVIANILLNGMIVSMPMIFYLMLAAMLGGIPMAFLGLAIGYRVSPDSARSLLVFTNLALLFSAFAIPNHGWWVYLRDIFPGYHWAQIVMSHYQGGVGAVSSWIWMAGFALLFYALAIWSYKTRKDLRKA